MSKLALLVAVMLLRGWVIQIGWQWFVGPSGLHVPATISFTAAVGLSVFTALMLASYSSADAQVDDKLGARKSFERTAAYSISFHLWWLAMAAVLHFIFDVG